MAIVVLSGALPPDWAAHGADDVPAAVNRPVDFRKDVRPILMSRCVRCHGETKQKGGLRLDRRADAIAGGSSGRAFEPGASLESLLIEYVSAADPLMVMPPEGDRLSEQDVGVLRAWIDQGAKWPNDEHESAKDSLATASPSHWAFRPFERPVSPQVKNRQWARSPIDSFILARLESENVAPSAESDRATLARRLSLDLIGLPPTPAESLEFVHDDRPDAYERLVDRLLASPRFGERWGRHWLDLARYADTDGYEKDSPRPNAWRYRDWVIEALNRDLPFDEFTEQQLAGDLLPGADLTTLAATGFHRNTLSNREGGADPEEFRVKAVVDRTNTTATVWLGLTLGCAQCHSHKYDPLTHKDYYGFFAFFNGQSEADLPLATPEELAAFQKADREYKSRLAKLESTTPRDEAAVKALAKSRPTEPASRLPVLLDDPEPPTSHVLIRGDFLRKGEEVRAANPALFSARTSELESPTRLDLARWLTSRENPLTARVAANRAWQALFGRGLVATPDDFGTRGEPPSHPELLDWLADEFVASGWGQKRLVRAIVTSSTYRQSSKHRPELEDRDPANLWLARQNRLRLEAETLRDSALSCAGLLDQRIGGPSVRPPQPAGISELTYAGGAKWVESRGLDRYRRGLYTWFQRTSPYPMLMTFDAPDANVCAVRRDRSNTPLQALTMLNDATFVEAARGIGGRIVLHTVSEVRERVAFAVGLCLGRSPDAEEIDAITTLYHRSFDDALGRPDEAAKLAGIEGDDRLALAERAAWVAVARALLNLDEFITRE